MKKKFANFTTGKNERACSIVTFFRAKCLATFFHSRGGGGKHKALRASKRPKKTILSIDTAEKENVARVPHAACSGLKRSSETKERKNGREGRGLKACELLICSFGLQMTRGDYLYLVFVFFSIRSQSLCFVRELANGFWKSNDESGTAFDECRVFFSLFFSFTLLYGKKIRWRWHGERRRKNNLFFPYACFDKSFSKNNFIYPRVRTYAEEQIVF